MDLKRKKIDQVIIETQIDRTLDEPSRKKLIVEKKELMKDISDERVKLNYGI